MDLLESLARPAAPRELAVGAWTQIAAEPHRAGPILKVAQRDGRRIRSRQRRPMMEVLFDLIRHHRRLVWKLDTQDPATLWVGMLVQHGLSAGHATDISGIDAAWETLATWDEPHPDPDLWLALRAGVSDLSATLLRDSLGPRVHAFFDASDRRAPVCLRPNPAKTTQTALKDALAMRGIESTPTSWAAGGLVLEERPRFEQLDLYRQGQFEVQDEGSQLLAELVQVEGVVVDLCAGAGGKTLAMAPHAHTVHAADVRSRALKRLQSRARRAGVRPRTHTIGTDGTLPPSLQSVRADRVLVDAPCSGTGILRRDPHNRLRLSPSYVAEMTQLQTAILNRAASLVRPGGRLIYSTCSVLKPENEERVMDFLTHHPAFQIQPAQDIVHDDLCDGPFLSVAPDTHGTDGFFGAVLVRNG